MSLPFFGCVVGGYFLQVTERPAVGGQSSSCHAKTSAAAELCAVLLPWGPSAARDQQIRT